MSAEWPELASVDAAVVIGVEPAKIAGDETSPAVLDLAIVVCMVSGSYCVYVDDFDALETWAGSVIGLTSCCTGDAPGLMANSVSWPMVSVCFGMIPADVAMVWVSLYVGGHSPC